MVDAIVGLSIFADAPEMERVCTLIISGLLSSAGAAMVWGCGVTILASEAAAVVAVPAALGALPLLVALVAIGAKEGLFRITRRVALRARSAVLLANAKHHRADAISSLAAAAGSCGVLVGLPVADTLAAGLVGFLMLRMGLEVARGDNEH